MNNFIYNNNLSYVIDNRPKTVYTKPLNSIQSFYINNHMSFSSLKFNTIPKLEVADSSGLESIEGYLPVVQDNLLGVE